MLTSQRAKCVPWSGKDDCPSIDCQLGQQTADSKYRMEELLARLATMHQEMLQGFDEVRQENQEIRRSLQELEERLGNQGGVGGGGARGGNGGVVEGLEVVGLPGEEVGEGGVTRTLPREDRGWAGPAAVPTPDKDIGERKVKKVPTRRVAKEFLDEGIRVPSGKGSRTEAG